MKKEIEMKCCCECGDEKPLDEFSKRNKEQGDGYQDNCKVCNALYRHDNREGIRTKAKDYRKKNREARNEYDREYRKSHDFKKYNAEYYAANKVKIAAKRKAKRNEIIAINS